MSLDALVSMDYDLAYSVVMRDDEVDQIKSDAYDRIKQAMSDHPDKTRRIDQFAADFPAPGAPCRSHHQHR